MGPGASWAAMLSIAAHATLFAGRLLLPPAAVEVRSSSCDLGRDCLVRLEGHARFTLGLEVLILGLIGALGALGCVVLRGRRRSPGGEGVVAVGGGPSVSNAIVIAAAPSGSGVDLDSLDLTSYAPTRSSKARHASRRP